MDIIKEQDFWLNILAKVKQMHALGNEICSAISTCGYGRGYDLSWHLSEKEDFDALVRAFDAEVAVEDNKPFMRYTCNIDGVRVFVLVDQRRSYNE